MDIRKKQFGVNYVDVRRNGREPEKSVFLDVELLFNEQVQRKKQKCPKSI